LKAFNSTQKERMVRALKRQPLTVHVPHFELVFYLNCEPDALHSLDPQGGVDLREVNAEGDSVPEKIVRR